MLISHNNLSGKTLNESYRLNRPERKPDETIREDYAASIPVTHQISARSVMLRVILITFYCTVAEKQLLTTLTQHFFYMYSLN